MKRFVSIMVLYSCLQNCTFVPKHDIQYDIKRGVTVSERVGDTIDSEEREHFGLFLPEIYVRPMTYKFESAAIYAIPGSGYELRLSAASKTILVVNKDPRGIDILTDYIDNYESVVESRENFEKKWGVVGYDNLGLFITTSELEITREYFVAELSRSARRDPLIWGTTAGLCVGGAAGLVIFLTAEREYDTYANDDFGCFYSGAEETAILGTAACVSGGISLVGLAIGAVIGHARGKAMESKAANAENSEIIDFIKEQRTPRILD